MKKFLLSFKILTICGFWRPTHFHSFTKKLMYNCYTLLTCLLVYTFTLSHLIHIIISSHNFEDVAESCFMVLSMLNVCSKITNIVYFQKDLSQLLIFFTNNQCKISDKVEQEIEMQFYKKTRSTTLLYAFLTETTCILITIRTFFISAKQILPFKAWLPFEITSQFRYWAVFFHQTIAHIIGANVQIANDTLICSMFIQASMQLEILKYRLKNLLNNHEEFNTNNSLSPNVKGSKISIVKCIKHHQSILEYSKKLNNVFNVTIFIQFGISSLVLCSSVYLLSKMKLVSLQFVSLMLYLFCMLYQIFLYCWYGNEIILESIDLGSAVYDMDWTILKMKDKKNLLILLLLFRKPIKFTSTFLITLSIESYSKILRISYSVFNLLQRV